MLQVGYGGYVYSYPSTAPQNIERSILETRVLATAVDVISYQVMGLMMHFE